MYLLTHGMELAIVKCLNSPEYLYTLRVAIGKATEKGMQEGLSAGIVHGKEGRALADVATHNPSTKCLSRDEHPSSRRPTCLKARENIANQRSALREVFVPLAEPISAAILTCTEGTYDTAPATADTNMALSTTCAFSSSINPISVDDYEVVSVEDQAVADENTASFPNVNVAKLNIPE
nr:hypothetical protein [Tanacetum cinerariifolium]GEW36753.1 hypothetical protein [Tanacetum cinerariifolium]